MNEFVQAFERLLADACTPAVVREIESGSQPAAAALWEAIEASGFADAGVPESQGGGGLGLPDLFEMMQLAGRFAVPLPVAHTMIARCMLAALGAPVPRGPVAIVASTCRTPQGLHAAHAPYAQCAAHFIVPDGAHASLRTRADAQCGASGIQGSLHGDLTWAAEGAVALEALPSARWQEAGAAATSALIAGALERVLAMTLQFANDRVQFGRSLGKFQAIQHQLAVMAENVAAARMAAQIGCESAEPWPQPLRAAVAKARTSEAVSLVAPLAHAIHGAIGVTAEFDLQLFTRRLHEWRADFGSERAWNAVIGQSLVDGDASVLDFMRAHIFPQ